jgi:hypothetical protein
MILDTEKFKKENPLSQSPASIARSITKIIFNDNFPYMPNGAYLRKTNTPPEISNLKKTIKKLFQIYVGHSCHFTQADGKVNGFGTYGNKMNTGTRQYVRPLWIGQEVTKANGETTYLVELYHVKTNIDYTGTYKITLALSIHGNIDEIYKKLKAVHKSLTPKIQQEFAVISLRKIYRYIMARINPKTHNRSMKFLLHIGIDPILYENWECFSAAIQDVYDFYSKFGDPPYRWYKIYSDLDDIYNYMQYHNFKF